MYCISKAQVMPCFHCMLCKLNIQTDLSYVLMKSVLSVLLAEQVPKDITQHVLYKAQLPCLASTACCSCVNYAGQQRIYEIRVISWPLTSFENLSCRGRPLCGQ